MTLISLLVLASWLLFSTIMLALHGILTFPAKKSVVRWKAGFALELTLAPLATSLMRPYRPVLSELVHRRRLPRRRIRTHQAQALMVFEQP